MPRKVMRRKASDNKYLHKDFHCALSMSIDYVEEHYGEPAVREYLRGFTRAYYAPLINAIKKRGLAALKEHFERIYALEGSEIDVNLSGGELVLKVGACPAVTHIRGQGHPVARLFVETTRTVNEALCEGSPFHAELLEYDERTGRSVQRFSRRKK